MPLLLPDDIRKTMPNVGDKLMLIPTVYTSGYKREARFPRPCVVTYVHREHLWYTVRFEYGVYESYKLPQTDYNPGKETP